jgi:hypothetical protein
MSLKNTVHPFILFFVLLLSSCSKDAGFGGLSSVGGKVYAKDYTPNSGIIEAEGYTADIKVMIAVENSGVILKETRTHWNGSYKFSNLRKGKYEVWTFSDCDTCTNNETTILQSIEVKERKENLLLPDFLINL